jgi:DNA-binding MarR family transcriptional regulator
MTNPEAIASLLDRLSRLVHSLQYAQGLNPAQWNALRFLARANKYSTSPGVLAEYLRTTKGTVSQTLIALESKGLIQRIRCDADRRKVRLGLTKAGEQMLELDPLREIERASVGVPVADRDDLATALSTIVNDLCTHHEGPRFGVCGTCCHLDHSGESEGCGGTPRCGLTKDPLASAELAKICVEFSPCKNTA